MSQLDQEFHEDGTPRRKYELEEREESRTGLKAAVGLAIATGIVLMRNMLFGEEGKAQAAVQNVAQSTAQAPGGTVGAAAELSAATFEEEAEDEEKAQADEGSSASMSNVLISSSLTPVRIYDGALASAVTKRNGSLPAANNDNERLYGAAQGHRIDLSRFESSFDGDWGRFGGGPGREETPPDDDQDPAPNAPRTNRLPVVAAPVVLAGLPMNQSTLIAASELLRHTSDPDGDTLHIQGLTASSGTLVQRGNGLYAYMPALGDTSGVVFGYEVSDGEGSVAAVAYMDLLATVPATIVGTEEEDTLVGTPWADVIDGLDGDDRILGREGDDVIYGGAGNDTLVGGDGNDVIYGGSGNDVIYGGDGNDRLFGEAGDDILFGEGGDDILVGAEGRDHLFGGAGADILFGGEDDDVLDGGAGDDRVFGEDGDDIIVASMGDGDDHYDGGAGSDTYDASAITVDQAIDLDAGTASSTATGADTLVDIENVVGGSGDDVIVGDGGANVLTGGAGDDHVAGGDGDDIIVATVGDGNDTYDGGAGSDTYDASGITEAMVIDLEAGTASGAETGEDTLAGIENVIGGSGDDVIVANEEVNELSGGPGNDIFVFRSSKAIGKGQGSRDKILDFEVGDRIDLDDIHKEFEDAVEDHFEDHDIKKFILIGQQEEFSKPGQIRFKYDTIDGQAVTIIQGNIDRDADVEFELELLGTYQIRSDYFQTS